MEEILIRLLEFADKQTDWKENNDTTNNQVVQEFINRNRELVKKLNIPAVVGQSEQLLAFFRWYCNYKNNIHKGSEEEIIKEWLEGE